MRSKFSPHRSWLGPGGLQHHAGHAAKAVSRPSMCRSSPAPITYSTRLRQAARSRRVRRPPERLVPGPRPRLRRHGLCRRRLRGLGSFTGLAIAGRYGMSCNARSARHGRRSPARYRPGSRRPPPRRGSRVPELVRPGAAPITTTIDARTSVARSIRTWRCNDRESRGSDPRPRRRRRHRHCYSDPGRQNVPVHSADRPRGSRKSAQEG